MEEEERDRDKRLALCLEEKKERGEEMLREIWMLVERGREEDRE